MGLHYTTTTKRNSSYLLHFLKMFCILNIAFQFCLFTIYASNIISARITEETVSQDNSRDPLTLKSIGVQVGDNGCNCWMYAELTDYYDSSNVRSCVTNYLDNPGNDFVSGTYQSFSSPESLGDCYQKQFNDRNRIRMQVFHGGLDGVQIQYWNLQYNDGAKSYCQDDHWYDGNSGYSNFDCWLEGCSDRYSLGYRYIPEEGYIPGPGLIGEYQISKKQCEIDCNLRDECKAYSYSTPDGICKLIPQYYPTVDSYKSHQFCRKNETVCSFTEDSYIVGADGFLPYDVEKNVNTKEECSLRVKDYFPDSTGCIWNEEQCRGKYGNSQTPDRGGWETCLFFDQTFWPLEAANKMCTYYSKATGVKSQILCQDMCTSEDRCIGISYSEDNIDGYEDDSPAWHCYICYNDSLKDSEPGIWKIGFKRRPE